jgi:Cu/Ag efflux protein CusF
VKKLIALLPAALLLIGCSASTPESATSSTVAPAAASGAPSASGAVAIKRYPMHGKIIAVNPDKTVRIEAGPLGDWMGAMTMNYTVKDDADRAKLTTGTVFDATVVVNGDDFWVADVNPVK